jgi:nucleoside 2-deoxyribosyltransferase
MAKQLTIYTAASLFNGRENYFNFQLVDNLEKKGYSCFFPQRDGFEFGNLARTLSGKLSPQEVGGAVQNIIYFLDMGIYLPRCDVVLANLDEPLDPGVDVETCYAKLMGKFVVGFRTDARSPYGSSSDAMKGIHFFPAYQCHRFILHHMSCKTSAKAKEQLSSLVEKIDSAIKDANIQEGMPEYVSSNPNIVSILKGAEILFAKIKNIHSAESLEEIASRYSKHKSELNLLGPKIV